MSNKSSIVKITGVISDCHITSPIDDFVAERLKFTLKLIPDNSMDFQEVDWQVDELKEEHARERAQDLEAGWIEDNDYPTYQHKDRISQGTEFLFETFHPIKMEKTLAGLADQELMFKRVQVLGHIQIMKDGNAYLSPHYIADAPLVYDEVDFDEIDEEDW